MNPPPLPPAHSQGPSGIGGWLAFFIVVLLVISPALNIYNYNDTEKGMQAAMAINAEAVKPIYDFVKPIGYGMLAMAGVSALAGVMLLIKAPHAVKLAKFVTCIPLLFAIGCMVYVQNSSLPDMAKEPMFKGSIQDLI